MLGELAGQGAKNYLYLDPATEEASEFDCNAEQAMEYLGIKRSRLTQISGNQLPCARIKVDRYIRPMYRWSDVQSYRERLQLSVSYSKSKQEVHEASSELTRIASDFATTLANHRQLHEQTMEQQGQKTEAMVGKVMARMQQLESTLTEVLTACKQNRQALKLAGEFMANSSRPLPSAYLPKYQAGAGLAKIPPGTAISPRRPFNLVNRGWASAPSYDGQAAAVMGRGVLAPLPPPFYDYWGPLGHHPR